jgi:hypothetical protein
MLNLSFYPTARLFIGRTRKAIPHSIIGKAMPQIIDIDTDSEQGSSQSFKSDLETGNENPRLPRV